MKFIDEATITVQSGNGGRGIVSFRRERFVPKGGPDGGDGGRGGNVILSTATQKRTLYHFRYQHHFKAENGHAGQGKQRTGKSGDDLVIEVPPGTLVTDAETGDPVKDFTRPDEQIVIARGGRGGMGNTHFKTSTHQTPRFAQSGEPGETRALRLELKLLADVGIIGLPNAGKSTLISAMSAAKPKIADYPFTTLTPTLGVVYPDVGEEPFLVADIPGLIEGAHTGAGLGIQFLRHIERNRILIHLIDASEVDADHPLATFDTVNRELAQYSPALAAKPQLVVLNKLDIPAAEVGADLFEMAAREAGHSFAPLRISAAAHQNVNTLIIRTVQLLTRYSDDTPSDEA